MTSSICQDCGVSWMECKWEQSWILMTDTRTHTADLSRRIQVVVSSSNKLIIACRLIPNLSSHTVSNSRNHRPVELAGNQKRRSQGLHSGSVNTIPDVWRTTYNELGRCGDGGSRLVPQGPPDWFSAGPEHPPANHCSTPPFYQELS